MADYAQLRAFYNKNLMTQATSIELVTESGNIPVHTLTEGLAGFSDGSGQCTIAIGFVVPIGGTEDPYQEDCATRAFVEMQVAIGGKDYIGIGKLDNVNISQSVNAQTEGTMNWTGPLKPVE